MVPSSCVNPAVCIRHCFPKLKKLSTGMKTSLVSSLFLHMASGKNALRYCSICPCVAITGRLTNVTKKWDWFAANGNSIRKCWKKSTIVNSQGGQPDRNKRRGGCKSLVEGSDHEGRASASRSPHDDDRGGSDVANGTKIALTAADLTATVFGCPEFLAEVEQAFSLLAVIFRSAASGIAREGFLKECDVHGVCDGGVFASSLAWLAFHNGLALGTLFQWSVGEALVAVECRDCGIKRRERNYRYTLLI